MFPLLNKLNLNIKRKQHQDLDTKYGLLADDENAKHSEDSASSSDSIFPSSWITSNPRHVSLLHYLGLILTVIAFIFLLFRKPSDQQCARQLSIWSPALEAVEYVEYDFENDFTQESIYRGPPTQDMEDAWYDLWNVGGVLIPPNKLHLLNRTEDQYPYGFRPVPKENGTGYVAILDVFHHIHCLDLIRKFTWLQSGHYSPPGHGTFDNPETPINLQTSDVGQRMHVDHCIETLRKSLMCHGDVTPFLAIEDPDAPVGHVADFSLHQKCRDFGLIRRWMGEHAAMD